MFYKSLEEWGTEQNEAEEIIEKLQKSPATNITLERKLSVKYSQLIENEKNTAMISAIIDEILEIGKFAHATIINQLIKKLSPYTTNFLMLLAIAKERKIGNERTYAAVLGAIVQNNQLSEKVAVEILEEAEKNRKINTAGYACTINKLARSNIQNGEQVIDILKRAIAKKLANQITYASVINAIAKSKNPDADLAFEILNLAKKNDMANLKTYASTINAIAKSKTPNPEMALELVKEASEEFADNDGIIYGSLLDVLYKVRKQTPKWIEIAQIYIDKIKTKQKLPSVNVNELIDLHGIAAGTAYFSLKAEINKLLKHVKYDFNLIIVYGKGGHSIGHEVKNGVEELAKEIKEEIKGVEYIQDPDNDGRLIMKFKIKPPKKVETFNQRLPQERFNQNFFSVLDPENSDENVSEGKRKANINSRRKSKLRKPKTRVENKSQPKLDATQMKLQASTYAIFSISAAFCLAYVFLTIVNKTIVDQKDVNYLERNEFNFGN